MLKIGEKIKELRKAQTVTQEKLADYLNISYQAVSKWENGLALPDITLLPQLASFFGVTADELLGVTKPEQSEELTQYEKQYFEFGREGKVLEKIALCREVLEKYPRNYQWMLNLAYGLVSYAATKEQKEYSKEHKFTEKAINLCERVLEDCTTDSIRHGAIQILCYNYPYVGKKAEAIQLAEHCSRNALFYCVCTSKSHNTFQPISNLNKKIYLLFMFAGTNNINFNIFLYKIKTNILKILLILSLGSRFAKA